MRKRNVLFQWVRSHWLEIILFAGFIAIVAWYGALGLSFLPRAAPTPTPMPTPTLAPTLTPTPVVFDGEVAVKHVLAQEKIGPRPTGSEGSAKLQGYIGDELRQSGWTVEEQPFTYQAVQGRNIIGKKGQGPVIIVGAHYDTRRQADNDPDPSRRKQPVPGANDGSSGVAVLLELARTLSASKLRNEVWLVFFDAEDNGQLDGWEYAVGSRYMAEQMTAKPEAVIIVDMIGDADQQIYKERNSTAELVDQLWQIAAELGYQEHFVPEYKWSMMDDHTAFLEKGIPAADIIDFDYPYWHTTQDTPDKVAADSLERVGRVLQAYLEGKRPAGAT